MMWWCLHFLHLFHCLITAVSVCKTTHIQAKLQCTVKIFICKKIPVDNFPMEKNSFWLFSYGKKFKWKFFLWKKIPIGILPLEKSSCWNCFFGKKLQCYICIGINFSCRKKVWKKVPSFTFIILSVVLGIEPGIKFPCKAFLWKKIHI